MSSSQMRLSREEFSQLTILLQKLGFMGYYDFLDVLKIAAGGLSPAVGLQAAYLKDPKEVVDLIHKVMLQMGVEFKH